MAASAPKVSANMASMSRQPNAPTTPPHLGEDLDIGQAPHPAGDDQALQRVGPRHAGPEELLHRGAAHAPQLRALDLDGPEGGLDGPGRLPAVAVAVDGVIPLALVAPPAQLAGDDLLQDRLEGEPDAQAGDALERLGELHVAGEGLVDLGAQALVGDTRAAIGCRSPFVLSAVRRNLRPRRVYTRDRTPPSAAQCLSATFRGRPEPRSPSSRPAPPRPERSHSLVRASQSRFRGSRPRSRRHSRRPGHYRAVVTRRSRRSATRRLRSCALSAGRSPRTAWFNT